MESNASKITPPEPEWPSGCPVPVCLGPAIWIWLWPESEPLPVGAWYRYGKGALPTAATETKKSNSDVNEEPRTARTKQ